MSTARSRTYVDWVWPKPRYAAVGVVVVATAVARHDTASQRYGPGTVPVSVKSGPAQMVSPESWHHWSCLSGTVQA